MPIRRRVMVALLYILLSGCAYNAEAPIAAAKLFMKTVVSLDTVKASPLSCNTVQSEIPVLVRQFGGLVLYEGSIDVSNLKYEAVDGNAESTHIHISGVMKIHRMPEPTQLDILVNNVVSFVKSGNDWLYCGGLSVQ